MKNARNNDNSKHRTRTQDVLSDGEKHMINELVYHICESNVIEFITSDVVLLLKLTCGACVHR